MSDHAIEPSLLHLRPSFGFGDRLGLAAPGHITACRKGGLSPVLAQQSVRELSRTGRTPDAVMAAAREGVRQEGWTGIWGADGDHLKTKGDVMDMARAGFTFFTIDPSDHVVDGADSLQGRDLSEAAEEVAGAGVFDSLEEAEGLYWNRIFEVPGLGKVAFDDRELLYRAVVKYGKAVVHAQRMAGWIQEAKGSRNAEIEMSVDETATPTSILEHLFIGLELKRRGVEIVSLAPRFLGEFEKGIDYKGDLELFESSLKGHLALARLLGPYKLSLHSGSDKFSIYPIVGRVCQDLFHVKTAGTSYLEGLRVAAREAPSLFLEILEFALSRFDEDKVSYHISADPSRLPRPDALGEGEREALFLNENDGRQVLHVTYGSVLTQGRTGKGRPFKEAILELLEEHGSLHRDLLASHLGRHVELLLSG